MAEAATRAGYGAASALVDLQPLAAAVRDRVAPSAGAVLGGVACLAALAAMASALGSCLRARAPAPWRRVGWLALCWLAPILAFGFLWSNSDDQFFFQLAPILGLLAAVSASGAVGTSAGAGASGAREPVKPVEPAPASLATGDGSGSRSDSRRSRSTSPTSRPGESSIRARSASRS